MDVYKYSSWRDGLVVSALDQRPRGRGFESVGCGLSCSNRGPVALCTLCTVVLIIDIESQFKVSEMNSLK